MDNKRIELYDLSQDIREEKNWPRKTGTRQKVLALMEKAHVSHPSWPTPDRKRSRNIFRQKNPQGIEQNEPRFESKTNEAESTWLSCPQIELDSAFLQVAFYPNFAHFVEQRKRVFVLSNRLSVFEPFCCLYASKMLSMLTTKPGIQHKTNRPYL